MKYYYIFYYTNHLDYPDHPYFSIKLDHEPTYEEIIKNKPVHHQTYQKIDGYYVKSLLMKNFLSAPGELMSLSIFSETNNILTK